MGRSKVVKLVDGGGGMLKLIYGLLTGIKILRLLKPINIHLHYQKNS
jgi:hypothetical protein